MTPTTPPATEDEAVVEVIEAIDNIPDGDWLHRVSIWQYSSVAMDAKLAGRWGWYVESIHSEGPGHSGAADPNKVNRKLAKMSLIRGDREWPKR